MDDDDLEVWPAERRRRPRSDPPVCQSVHGAYHALTRRIGVVARDHGLDPSEALVLQALLRDPGCAPAVLRHGLGFHRSTLSSILGRLERSGLIKRNADASDGRRLELALTPAGKIAAEIADSLLADVEHELAVFTSKSDRRGAEAVFAACVAITRPDGALDI
jgi:DNA-binding MarR family transcriptional regulator